MNGNRIVCRFCLQRLDDGHEIMNYVAGNIIDIVQIQMNFDTSEILYMCDNCVETIKRLLAFKLTYVNVEQMLLELSLRDNKAIVDLKDVCKAENDETFLYQDTDICRLCMKFNEAKNFTLISSLNGNAFEEMWMKYMNEVDLTITRYPKVCFHCKENIQCYSKFILDVQAVETETNSNGQTKIPQDPSLKMFKCLRCSYETQKKSMLNVHKKRHLDRSQRKMHKCLQCGYETHRKSRFNLHTQTHLDRSQRKMHKCLQCSFETHRKDCLNLHTKIHLDRSQLKMYKCLQCSYETHRKYSLTWHTKTHLDRSQLKMYKCLQCSYETHRRGDLSVHKRTHMDRSQLKMYKCPQCSYETHRKSSLNVHTKTHLDRNQLKMHKCLECSYETPNKYCLKRHREKHLDRSQLTMYKCLQCSYETFRKRNLKQHTKIHLKLGSTDN